jgi:hypothetical protein
MAPPVVFGQTRAAPRNTEGNQEQVWAKREQALTYTKAFIDSLGWAKSGRSRISSDANTDGFTVLFYEMKLANRDYEKGAAAVDPFSASPVETIRISSQATRGVFVALIDGNSRTASLFSEFLDGKKPTGLGTLSDKLSDNMVQIDEAWKMLVTASIATTYVLLEPDSTSDRMQLNITSTERDELAASLEKAFGADKLKDGLQAGQFGLEAAAAVLYSHLKSPWKTREAR